jgi:hypothetical protein
MTPLALAIINALAVLGPPAVEAITKIIQAQHGAPATEADHQALGKLIYTALQKPAA